MRTSALVLLAPLIAQLACGSSSSSPTCSLPGAGSTGVPSACPREPGVSTAQAPNTAIPLGRLQVGKPAQFDVPPNTASITIVQQAVSAPDSVTYPSPTGTVDNSAVPLRLLDPGNGVVYDDTASVPSDPALLAQRKAFFGASAPGTGTLTIPNTTGGLALLGAQGLAAGRWTLTVSDYSYECSATPQCCSGGSGASTYDVTVVLKGTPGGQVPAAGNLDVTIWFGTPDAPLPPRSTRPASDAALTAAKAAAHQDSDLNRMEQTLKAVMLKAGITVRTFAYRDLPADVQAEFSRDVSIDETGSCSPLARLFQLASDGNTLNVFFVAGLTSQSLTGGQTVVGVDGTVPGPSTIAGSMASGVAVGAQDLRVNTTRCSGSSIDLLCGADETAYIIAHEAGHYLGLYHTTESDGTAFDPLLDTPACACSRCKPASATDRCSDANPPPASGSEHQMLADECTTSTCGGGDNLMFWLLDHSLSAGNLTTEQQRVMRANPLIQ